MDRLEINNPFYSNRLLPPPPAAGLREHPTRPRLYSEGVEAVTAGTAHALAETYDFGRHQRLLDLGGGTGSFLIPVLSRFGNLQSTLFDLPASSSLIQRG
jgi:hypothetical protein